MLMSARHRIMRRDAPAPATLNAMGGVHPVLARVLIARGLHDAADNTLDLARLLPPDSLKGLDGAVEILLDAVTTGARLLVIGDYDADGATSTALCVSTLRAMGADVDFLVPDRFRFGYGLSPEIVDVAAQAARPPTVILTVDNGISSIAGVARAQALGIRVVVTDHHLPGAQLPTADAMVNPNQPGCLFPGKALAGVGVAFYVMSALRRALHARAWFSEARPAPNLADTLDLVALGTIADVVPLDTNNRVLVAQGLRRIRAGRVRPGIAALIAVGGRNRERLVAADLGFAVGPRLNAAGRLDDMSLGIRCLLATDDAEATRYAAELDALNSERRSIEGNMQQEAQTALKQILLDEGELPYGLCLFDTRWHPGVIGILASRIKERHHRPVIAFAAVTQGSDELRGSARSINGLHIRDVLDSIAARHPALIRHFGGHAMAAGLTLARANLGEFTRVFDAAIRRAMPASAFSAQLISDGELPFGEIGLPFAELLRDAGPWGQGFPEPLFDGEFTVLAQRLVGGKHLKMVLAAAPSGRGAVVDAIAFNVDTAQWPNAARRVHIAYRLDINEYRGLCTPQLMVELLEGLGEC